MNQKQNSRKPCILLRNGRQSQNIGDIAYYMGMMELLETLKLAEFVYFRDGVSAQAATGVLGLSNRP